MELVEGYDIDTTAYSAVLVGPKTGSSAIGALLEALDIYSGLELMLSPLKESGAVKISFSFAEIMGEETSAKIMRQDLEAMIKDAHLYMKGAFYLFGETSLDITKDSRFRSVMRAVGPLIYLHLGVIFYAFHVGKSTSPMDGMGI